MVQFGGLGNFRVLAEEIVEGGAELLEGRKLRDGYLIERGIGALIVVDGLLVPA